MGNKDYAAATIRLSRSTWVSRVYSRGPWAHSHSALPSLHGLALLHYYPVCPRNNLVSLIALNKQQSCAYRSLRISLS